MTKKAVLKIVKSAMILLLILNISFFNIVSIDSLAQEAESGQGMYKNHSTNNPEDEVEPDKKQIQTNTDSGQANMKKGQKSTISSKTSSMDVVGTVASVINFIGGTINVVKKINVNLFNGRDPDELKIYKLTKDKMKDIKGIEIFDDPKYLEDSIKYEITLDKIIFRELPHLDANVVSLSKENKSEVYKAYKKGTAKNYFRNLLAGIVIVFIGMFIGIISLIIRYVMEPENAEKTANTKIFLQELVKSIGFMFLIPLMLVVLFAFNDIICSILLKIRETFLSNGNVPYEYFIYAAHSGDSTMNSGFPKLANAINFIMIAVFAMRYIKLFRIRFFTILTLVGIGPYVMAQNARKNLANLESKQTVFQQYIITLADAIYLEPVYMLLYLVFIYGMKEIFITSPVFGFLILFMFPRLEKVIKNIFGLRDQTTIRSSSENGTAL